MTNDNIIDFKTKLPITEAVKNVVNDELGANLFGYGVQGGIATAKRMLSDFPNFPEGVKRDITSTKTDEEMFILYCNYRFHDLPAETAPKRIMSNFYQENRDLEYGVICEWINKGFNEATKKIWNSRGAYRPVPEIENPYPI